MLPNFNTMILCETILGKTLANIYFPQIVSPLDNKVRVLPKSELVSQRDFVVSHMVKDYLKKQRLLTDNYFTNCSVGDSFEIWKPEAHCRA